MNGAVKFFNASKNYGFVSSEDGKEYFFHISNVDGGKILKEGEKVTFDIEKGDRGEKAVNVKKVEE